jgi:hypothetical protein
MDIVAAKKFISAGNAIFTIDNGKGEHFTFKVKTPDDALQALDFGFISLLTGPDNGRDYTYMGTVDFRDGTARETRNSKIGRNDRRERYNKAWRVADWLLKNVWNAKAFPEGYTLRHEGRCGRCGRRLTVPESITNGIGPECIKHMAPAMVAA